MLPFAGPIEMHDRPLSQTVRALEKKFFFLTILASYHNVTDAGKRHKTPGLETKDFINYGTAGSMTLLFL